MDQRAVNAPLGNIGKYAPPPSAANAAGDESIDQRKHRFALQSLARIALPDHRIQNCLRSIAPQRIDGRYEPGYYAEIKHSATMKRARLSNLETCKNVWTCPVCAGRIARERRHELTRALYHAEQDQRGVLHVTFTLRHRSDDKLKDLVRTLRSAIRAVWSSAAAERLRAKYGIIGNIRALEVTHGQSGWHPHAHVLVFTQHALTPSMIEEFTTALRTRWIKKLDAIGGDADWQHGIDVKAAHSYIAEYVAKFGRLPESTSGTGRVEFEIGSAGTKRAHGDGVTPFGLLEIWARDLLDPTPLELFREYGEAMKHERQLHWSNGLADKLHLPESVEDDAALVAGSVIAEDEKTLAYIPAYDWIALMRRDEDIRPYLLNAADQGFESLAAYLKPLGIIPMRGEEIIGQPDHSGNASTPDQTRDTVDHGKRSEIEERQPHASIPAWSGAQDEARDCADQGYLFDSLVLAQLLPAAWNTYGRG